MLEYVAKFTELSRFEDDYVATEMAKVRNFEDGFKLSIRGKIVGLLLQDMDSMVSTAMAIEREIDNARSIQDEGASEKRKEDQPSLSLRKKQRISIPRDHSVQCHRYQGQSQEGESSQTRQVTCHHYHQLRHFRGDCPYKQRS